MVKQWLLVGREGKEKSRPPPSLPHDVIFKILLLLPAKLLYEVMRYVCWEWYNIVNDTAFITSHLQMMSSSSSKGILFQQFENRESAYYVERNTAGSDLEVTVFRIPIPGEIFGSCNGLVTVYTMLDHPRIFHVVNPVTGLVVSLPPVLGGREPHGQETALTCTSSGCFKVVYIAQESFEDTDAQLTIFTVGVDKSWRLINLDEMFMTRPVVVAGFVYLIDIHHRCGFALDVDSETVYRLTMPCIGEFTSIDASFVVVQERSFGVFIYVKERRRWELWDLVDVKSCKWVNIVVIDEASLLDSKLGKSFRPSTVRCFLRPFYLKNGDLWMKIQDKDGYHVVCYNLETGSFQYYQYGYAFFGHHFNSLVKI